MKESVYDYKVKDINGKEVSMADFKDKVLLIVNVASTCGFTPQYKGLQRLYDKYNQQGLEVLGFPCNQFGKQEKEENADIKEFCESQFSGSGAERDGGAWAPALCTRLFGDASSLLMYCRIFREVMEAVTRQWFPSPEEGRGRRVEAC